MSWWMEQEVPKVVGIDPQAKSYVDNWLSLSNTYGFKITEEIKVGVIKINDGNVIGRCYRSPVLRQVILDQSFWTQNGPIEKAALIYHELAHCYCNENHGWGKTGLYTKDGTNDSHGFFWDECPKSLMYPYVVGEECYLRHYAEYMDEMFKKCEPNK